MNLNPLTWLRTRKAFENSGGEIAASTREVSNVGPWANTFSGWIPRTVNPALYEALREAIPPLDGGINRLVTMDGIVRVAGKNTALVDEISEWMEALPVNDAETGLQAMYSSQGNELYEQGFTLAEWVPKADDSGVAGVRVADSKGVHFMRTADGLEIWYRAPGEPFSPRGDGTDRVQAIIRGTTAAANINAQQLRGWGFRKLDPARLLYAVHAPEADNPYGVSIMRSIEFVAQILLRIENATGNVWDRFGDPAFSVTYTTSNRKVSAAELAVRKTAIARELAAVLSSKRNGNAADFVSALGADDAIKIDVIGALDQVLELEMPARHMLEQIVSKLGLPSWMLGYHWSTAERLAESQSEVVLQESKTRFERRRAGLTRLVAAELRMRGRTWRPGDWALVQELPNLRDELKRAQAGFLIAQTEMMRSGAQPGAAPAADPPPPTGVDNNLRAADRRNAQRQKSMRAKAAGDGEPWAEDDANLPAIEAGAVTAQLALWDGLQAQVLDTLGLEADKAAKATAAWQFDPAKLPDLIRLGDAYAATSSAADGPILRAMWASFLRGAINAGGELDADQAVEDRYSAQRQALIERGGAQFRTTYARAYRADIVGELASGAYDGLNPQVVARMLAKRFDAHEYDWERLARTEIAQAQSDGKLAEYDAAGITRVDYVTANDSRVSRICRDLAAAGPYALADAPVPGRDSHPNCRCTLLAADDDE